MSNAALTYTFVNGNVADATEVNQNFQDILTAINNGALNSDNYGSLSVGSTHIADGSIITAKIAAGAVTANELGASAVTTAKINNLGVDSSKLAANAVIESKVDWSSANSGVLALRGGPSYDTNGTRIAFVSSGSIIPSSGAAYTMDLHLNFTTQSVYGNPAWSAVPILIGWGWYGSGVTTEADIPDKAWCYAKSTITADFKLYFITGASGTASGIFVAAFVGAA